MLAFFFHRFSKMVLLMEALGGILFAIAAVRIFMGTASKLTTVAFIAVVLLYLFLRICASMRFYKDAPRWAGIELQFKKAMVPTSYIMAIVGLVLMLSVSAWPLIVALFLLAVIAHVNVILLYFHFKDRDPLPVNFFSGKQVSQR